MAHLKRGIAPDLLVSQVKNTMPYLFDPEPKSKDLAKEADGEAAFGQFPPAKLLKEYERSLPEELSHFEYFRLCLSCHYLTCGTPVPTDVDNQIRLTLWPAHLPLEDALEMAELVLESRSWDFTAVTGRAAYGALGGPWEKEPLSGHLGEWFTVSSGAYCALARYSDPVAKEKRRRLFDNIADEVKRHSEIFGSLWRAGDGIGALKTSASIAHNFGDLDRVMDMWDLAVDDPLRLDYYKLAISPFDSNRKLRYLGRLWVAGELYKSTIEGSSMALENHRHFALRKARSLRKSRAFLITTGPFFDDWGGRVARNLKSAEASEDLLEVVEALKHGWERLGKTVGYGRALRGIQEECPELGSSLDKKDHTRRSILEMPQDRFEKKWADEALKLMDDIPSRA
jgi:hypothetical protein